MPQKGSCHCPARGWMHELIELDPAILIACYDHSVVNLDQVFALHCQHLVAHLFGLLLVVECNEHEITHFRSSQPTAVFVKARAALRQADSVEYYVVP